MTRDNIKTDVKYLKVGYNITIVLKNTLTINIVMYHRDDVYYVVVPVIMCPVSIYCGSVRYCNNLNGI